MPSKLFYLWIFYWLALVMTASGAQAAPESLYTPASQIMEKWLKLNAFLSEINVGGVKLYASDLVKQYYSNHQYQLLWSRAEGPNQTAFQMLDVITRADEEGLKPQEYHFFKIRKLIQEIQAEQKQTPSLVHPVKLAALDLLLTDAFLLYAYHAARGRLDPENLAVVRVPSNQDLDLLGYLEKAIAEQKISATLQQLLPSHAQYQRLKLALQHYRSLAAHISWQKLPSLELSLGEKNDTLKKRLALLALRSKLQILGDLSPDVVPDTSPFDENLVMALKQYQSRHGLKATGSLDEATWQQLNQPWEYYIRTIIINLERWRWLPHFLGERYILVNIPAFKLQVFEKEQCVFDMKVVVGQGYSRTPVFSDVLRWVVLNPYWEIPPSIIIQQKLWSLKHDPEFFKKYRIQVMHGWEENAENLDPQQVNWQRVKLEEFYTLYRFQQAPSRNNPLGRIKFVFPNQYNVYLHDTPERELFDAQVRNFSSGCIRIEKPIRLAVYILRPNRIWTKQRIIAAMNGEIEQKIRLTQPIPIHILYQTCWLEDNGMIYWWPDIYRRDKHFGMALEDILVTIP